MNPNADRPEGWPPPDPSHRAQHHSRRLDRPPWHPGDCQHACCWSPLPEPPAPLRAVRATNVLYHHTNGGNL